MTNHTNKMIHQVSEENDNIASRTSSTLNARISMPRNVEINTQMNTKKFIRIQVVATAMTIAISIWALFNASRANTIATHSLEQTVAAATPKIGIAFSLTDFPDLSVSVFGKGEYLTMSEYREAQDNQVAKTDDVVPRSSSRRMPPPIEIPEGITGRTADLLRKYWTFTVVNQGSPISVIRVGFASPQFENHLAHCNPEGAWAFSDVSNGESVRTAFSYMPNRWTDGVVFPKKLERYEGFVVQIEGTEAFPFNVTREYPHIVRPKFVVICSDGSAFWCDSAEYDDAIDELIAYKHGLVK